MSNARDMFLWKNVIDSKAQRVRLLCLHALSIRQSTGKRLYFGLKPEVTRASYVVSDNNQHGTKTVDEKQ